MPFLTPQHGRLIRKPRNHSISASDQKPRTQSLSQSSNSKPTISNVSNETKKLLRKKTKKKRTFKSMLGCGASTSVSAPVIIRSVVNRETERARTKKKKKKIKKQNKTMSCSTNIPDVCCAPGVGIASDVIPRSRAEAERTTQRVRSCSARRTANTERASASDFPSANETNQSRLDASNDRELHHWLRQHFPGGLPQLVMFQHNLLSEGTLDGLDQYGDWRLDVDNMSYEELLDLSDRIGYVGTGLREDEILHCLRKTKRSILESLPLLKSTERDWKCSICQESWKEDDKMGKLDCGHYHHLHCIKQWLLQKNACPVCKTAAVADN